MAVVNGTINSDFIHRLGDGLIPPVGSTDITGVTNGNDSIFGGSGTDTIHGDDGSDRIDGGTGADSMVGGNGGDTYIVDDLGDIVVEQLGGGIDRVDSSVTFTLGANTEALFLTGTGNISAVGNELDNTLVGNSGANTLIGNAGNDTMNGSTGADAMFGGAGNDVYVIDDVGDVITEAAGEGNDMVQSFITHTLAADFETLILVGTAAVNATGNASDNTVNGNSANNVLSGEGGNDAISGQNGNDTLFGGSGDDVLNGGAGIDSMVGSIGNDTFVFDNSADVIVELAGEGTDLVQSFLNLTLSANLENLLLLGSGNINGAGNSGANIVTGNTGNNQLFGQAGNDSLNGGDGNDTLFGQGDDDTLNGALGADSMVGGTGNDTYVRDNAGDIVVENAGEGTDLVESTLSYTLLTNFENLTLLGTGNLSGAGNTVNNVITGNTGNNQLFGLAGNDTLNGGDGNDSLFGQDDNDVLNGGAGNDSLVGGNGNDLYIVDSTADIVSETASTGNDTVSSSVTFTLGTDVENLELTGSGAISGTGNAIANTITGNSGNNTLNGLDGNDTLNGGAGNDTLVGGANDDTYIVDSTTDTITELAGGGNDTLQSSVTITLMAEVENLVLTGTGNTSGTGNNGNNTITGNSGNNTLNGGSGTDTLIGGAGNDVYVVDTATDTITEAAGGGNDTVQSSASITLAAEVEHLVLTGATGLSGTGNSLNNTITGTSAGDTLNGGTGNDTLTGGAGNDTYVVDSANDSVVEVAGGGTDTVQTSVNYTLAGEVENLVLLTGGLTGTGNGLNNTITGSAANDTLVGGGGNDTLNASDGNDRLDGGTGNDSMTGGFGDDTYVIDSTADSANEVASAGTDTVETSVNNLTLGSQLENLVLIEGSAAVNGAGNGLNNAITGNSGNNQLFGGVGNDTLSGNSGDDSLTGSTGVDSFFGGTGNDTFFLGSATDISTGETYDGGADTDRINGSGVGTAATFMTSTFTSIEEIVGFSGGVTLSAAQLDPIGYLSTGAVTIGSAGTVNLTGATIYTGNFNLHSGGNTLTLEGNTTSGFYGIVNGGGGNDVVTQVSAGAANNVSFYGNGGNDSLTGASGSDYIDGGSGNDTLIGNAGNDYLTGGAGLDSMLGGVGNDTFYFESVNDVISGELYDGGADTDDLVHYGGNAVDLSNVTLTSIERLIGFLGGLTLTAAQASSTTYLATGAITISTTGNIEITGNSEIYTSIFNLNAGGNTLILQGGVGYLGGFDGIVNGGAGNDVITLTSPLAGATYGVGFYGNGGNDSLTSVGGADNLYGGSGNDTMTAGAGQDALLGGAGLDLLYGGDDDDTFDLDTANDVVAGEVYDGGSGNDIIMGFDSTAYDFTGVTLTSIEQMSGMSGGVTLTAGQLDAMTYISTGSGAVTLGTTGTVDLSDANLFVPTFNLNAGGNTLTLRGGNYSNAGFYGTVNGGAGADTVTIVDPVSGSSNQITIFGNGGNDSLTGGSERDVFYGGANNDTLTGNAGTDYLIGGNGTDLMYGGADNDVFYANDASDVVSGEVYDGGTGTDRIDVAWATSGVNFSSTTWTSIEELYMSAYGVTLTAAQLDGLESIGGSAAISLGTTGSANLTGALLSVASFNLNAGGNTLTIQGGDWSNGGFSGTVNGGAGADTVTMVAPVSGGTYGVSLSGAGGTDSLTGGAGTDSLYGGTENDTLSGLGEFDYIFGDAGNDSMLGGAGGDFLTGGAGADQMYGGADDDRFYVSNASDVIAGEIFDGGTGTDTIVDEGSSLTANFNGATWNSIEGLSGFGYGVSLTAVQLDMLQSLQGVSQISLTTTGTVNLTGAAISGLNTVNLNSGGNTLILQGGNLGNQGFFGTINGSASADVITMVAPGSGGSYGVGIVGFAGADSITGGAGFDSLYGGNDGDTLFGGDGGDTLVGGSGLDQVFGGNGDDRLYIYTGDLAVGENYQGGADEDVIDGSSHSGAASFVGSTVAGFESILGFYDGITMAAGHLDSFTGYVATGAITLAAGGVVDVSDAFVSTDIINLGSGPNTFTIGVDSYFSGAYSGAFDGTVNGAADADTITAVNIHGSPSLSVTFNGAGGNDSLTGSGGADTLDGGADNDTLTGGDGSDSLSGGNGQDFLFGGNESDVLGGGGAADSLSGGAGIDYLTGGAGNDTLSGGGGGETDYFIFGSAAVGGTDTITDFQGLGTNGYAVGYFVIQDGTTGPVYIGGSAFSNTGQTEVRYTGGNTLGVDLDGNGTQDFAINVTGLTSAGQLDSFDFLS